MKAGQGVGIMSKKLLIIALVGILFFVLLGMQGVDAKKSSKKGSLSEEEMTAMSTTVETLTKKMYGRGLFSPEDNQDLIDIKLKLDNQMLVASDPALAPLYFKVGVLYKSRDMKDEAIDCFQTILENFADTALAPKAAAQLKTMGVEVKLPTGPGSPGAMGGQ